MKVDSITFKMTGGATRDDLRFIFYKINKTDKIDGLSINTHFDPLHYKTTYTNSVLHQT